MFRRSGQSECESNNGTAQHFPNTCFSHYEEDAQPDELITMFGEYIARVTMDNLTNAVPYAQWLEDSRRFILSSDGGLLESIYWRLSLLAFFSQKLHICDECGRYFVLRDSRMMFYTKTCGFRYRKCEQRK